MKRIYLSKADGKLLGICSGIGETYEIDPNLIRVILVFLCLATAVIPMVGAYLVAWLLIPSGRPD
ncbi:MAG: PspC domain-containing protein [Planctomycetota bacterium]|jgi:phage shock protein C